MSWNRKQHDKKRTRGRKWMRMRHVVLVEEPLCYVCGKEPSVEVDHKKPICKGGTDDRDNLGGIGRRCHAKKTCADLGIRQRDRIGLDGYPIKDEGNS